MSSPRLQLDTLNAMCPKDFVAALGSVFEDAAWVAEAAAAGRPYPTVSALHEAMMAIVLAAPAERKWNFIAGHPELGSRVQRAELTADSQAEQGSLGLDRLSEAEFERFGRLNEAYRTRFGFPFIICVRRHTRDSILDQFERRLANNAASEHAAALKEIALITRLRLVALVEGPGMPQTAGHLSTHVLDTLHGRPAPGIRVSLYEIGASSRGLLTQATTDADGRTLAPLIGGEPLRIGTYELQFDIGHYFSGRYFSDSRLSDSHSAAPGPHPHSSASCRCALPSPSRRAAITSRCLRRPGAIPPTGEADPLEAARRDTHRRQGDIRS